MLILRRLRRSADGILGSVQSYSRGNIKEIHDMFIRKRHTGGTKYRPA